MVGTSNQSVPEMAFETASLPIRLSLQGTRLRRWQSLAPEDRWWPPLRWSFGTRGVQACCCLGFFQRFFRGQTRGVSGSENAGLYVGFLKSGDPQSIHFNGPFGKNRFGQVWYTIYHHWPVVIRGVLQPSINQPTNGKRTSLKILVDMLVSWNRGTLFHHPLI